MSFMLPVNGCVSHYLLYIKRYEITMKEYIYTRCLQKPCLCGSITPYPYAILYIDNTKIIIKRQSAVLKTRIEKCVKQFIWLII